MSFQGDVAGIGLGELLQGLVRGGRDGVLTLDGDDLHSFMGLAQGQVYFLAGPDEDTGIWRSRSQRAWAEAEDPNLEGERRSRIAHASRLETLYQMLGADNLHFRFEPGPLPTNNPTSLVRDESLEGFQTKTTAAPHIGPGYPVEFLLLEHARMADEHEGSAAKDLAAYDMPRAQVLLEQEPNHRDFLSHCDGNSTVLEISDRLGQPLRQCMGAIGEHMAHGRVRIADHRELLVAAQYELQHKRLGRASSRLLGWLRYAPPGPMMTEDAALLLHEWDEGNLLEAMEPMPAREARQLLHKLDFASPEREDCLARWQAYVGAHKRDAIAVHRTAVLSAQEVAGPETEEVANELLRLARNFQERSFPKRAELLLRLADTQVVDQIGLRIEIGTRMAQVGLLEMGSERVLAASRELIEQGQTDRAASALRSLLQVDPEQREAHGLLLQARADKNTRLKRRRNTLIGVAVLLMFSLVALVKLKSSRENERMLGEIRNLLEKPTQALVLLDAYFPNDESETVVELRTQIDRRRRELEEQQKLKFQAEFQKLEDECKLGKPLVALEHALAFERPYIASARGEEWPTRSALLNILAGRLEEMAGALELQVDATMLDLDTEEELIELLSDVVDASRPHDGEEGVEPFLFRITELRQGIFERQEYRSVERARADREKLERQQDILLASARVHALAGDYDRALDVYARLIELDEGDELERLLSEELTQTRRKATAAGQAYELALKGDHEAAREALIAADIDLTRHRLPWRVESVPPGARATFQDKQLIAPFSVDSRFGERIDILFELPGSESQRITVDGPTDLMVHMHRLPERSWPTTNRIEAVPVPVGEDHIIADRSGMILRLSPDGVERWSINLRSLGGIARTPVFLPRRPGSLLVLSEDGMAWLIDVEKGTSEGPTNLKSPPTEGPLVTRSGVSARFADGRVARWEKTVTPRTFKEQALFENEDPNSNRVETPPNQVVLRRKAQSERQLRSNWDDWTVKIADDEYRVSRTGESETHFTISRSGNWVYVAWEAPNSLVPDGRLWVSDDSGLRSFRPSTKLLPTQGE